MDEAPGLRRADAGRAAAGPEARHARGMGLGTTWNYLLAFFFVALVIGPSFAHLLELPNKMQLDGDAYFVVQNIYRGWALLGIAVVGALLTTLVLTIRLRGDRAPMRWAGVAFACIVATQIIFWSFTYPANAATENWTRMPANWEALRLQWEYSHAVSAFLNLAALLALVWSLLAWTRAARVTSE